MLMVVEVVEAVQLGAIGVEIVLTVKEDGVAINIASATTKLLYFTKPDGTGFSRTAQFVTDGTDGKVKWATTAETDLDVTGRWQVQCDLVMVGFDGPTSVEVFDVLPNLF